jgi:cell division transport system permease protein
MPSSMNRDTVVARKEPAQPPSAFHYFLREALRRMWISKRTSFVAVAMIAISLLILGAFLLLSENLQRAITRWQGTSRVNIYMEPEATAAQIEGVRSYLGSSPSLAHYSFITRAAALQRFRSYFTNLDEVVGQLDENPFPASFECQVTPRAIQSATFGRDIGVIRRTPGVEQVQFDWEWVNRLRRLVNIVNAIGFIAGGILAIAAAFTIANVIRLTMLLYREEIEIMRLVGATEQIIRGPFLIEGLIQGTIGGAAAVGLLYLFFELSRRLLAPSNAMLWSFLFVGFLPWPKIAGLVAGGTAAGYFGSWLSVREQRNESGRP